MCGLVGVAGLLTPALNKAFRDLLIIDVLRGSDATGMVVVPEKSDPIIYKEVGTPEHLFYKMPTKSCDYRGVISTKNLALIGHNRAATLGELTAENAHPFQFDHIYGAHNGTLRDWWDLKNYKEHDVDSKAIFDHISSYGLDDCWANFHGAAALTYWDDNEGTVNFIRNNERPLFYAYTEYRNSIIWASESWMIRAAAHRNKITLFKGLNAEGKRIEKGEGLVYEVAANTHMVFEPNAGGIEFLSRSKVEPKPFMKTPGVIGGGRNYKVGYTKPKATVTKGSNSKKQLNQGWGKNLEKGNKDSRGIDIEILFETNEKDKFYARFVNEPPKMDGAVEIHPRIFVWGHTPEEVEQIRTSISKGNCMFQTTARMRFGRVSGKETWHISTSGIKPKLNTVVFEQDDEIPFREEEEENVVPFSPSDLCKTFGGVYISKQKWYADFDRCECLWCDDPLDHQMSSSYFYLGRGEAFCEKCMDCNLTKKEINLMFPTLDLEVS